LLRVTLNINQSINHSDVLAQVQVPTLAYAR